MATRSFIAVERPTGKFDAIYCHWDGYPEYVGAILKQFYADPAKVDKLIGRGDASFLGIEIADGPVPNDENLLDKESGFQRYCQFYADRGETDVKAREYVSLQHLLNNANYTGAEYLYVFTDGAWTTRKV